MLETDIPKTITGASELGAAAGTELGIRSRLRTAVNSAGAVKATA